MTTKLDSRSILPDMKILFEKLKGHNSLLTYVYMYKFLYSFYYAYIRTKTKNIQLNNITELKITG